MANIKDYNSVLLQRAKDLENFLYGVCLTRVIQCEEYLSNGMFDPQVFFNQRYFVGCWNGKSEGFKLNPKNLNTYWKYRRIQNSVLGIPKDFIWRVLKSYKGKRFTLEQVLMKIGGYKYKDKTGQEVVVGEGRWTIINHGQDSYTNEKGDRVVKESWSKMIYPSDKNEWRNMFRDTNYDRFETIPNISKRVLVILNSLDKQSVEVKVAEETTKVLVPITEDSTKSEIDNMVVDIFNDPEFQFLINNGK